MKPHLRAMGHLPYGISGSHSFTCHPTQQNTPRLNPSQRLVLDLTTLEGWKAELTQVTVYTLHIKMVYKHTDSHPSKY